MNNKPKNFIKQKYKIVQFDMNKTIQLNYTNIKQKKIA